MSTTARRSNPARWDVAAPAALPVTAPDTEVSPGAAGADVPPESGVDAIKRRLTRLALDVHDGPMQNLAVIGFSLGDLRRRMHALLPPEQHTTIDSGMEQISSELVRVESELRALISALEHGAIKSVPLIEAIELEITAFEKRSRIKVELSFEGHPRAETDSQRIALQSVTRAALANVAKHAAATEVAIRLHGTDDTVTLEIEDNGRGFRSDAPPKTGRFGLVGMRDRIELLGGEFNIASRPGGPTKIVATLQLWRPPAESDL